MVLTTATRTSRSFWKRPTCELTRQRCTARKCKSSSPTRILSQSRRCWTQASKRTCTSTTCLWLPPRLRSKGTSSLEATWRTKIWYRAPSTTFGSMAGTCTTPMNERSTTTMNSSRTVAISMIGLKKSCVSSRLKSNRKSRRAPASSTSFQGRVGTE